MRSRSWTFLTRRIGGSLHRFTELAHRCVGPMLASRREREARIGAALETSGATHLVKGIQATRLEGAIIAVGVFSIFESMLQGRLQCADGFKEANGILAAHDAGDLADEFSDYQKAINVLKHGEGPSYDAMVRKGGSRYFRVLMPDESSFFEGDVSEVAILIDVNAEFVSRCASLIEEVARFIEKVRPGFHL